MKQYIAPLSNAIEKEYTKLRTLISQVPTAQRTKKSIEGTNGIVSVSDLIAYQIGWGTLLINWYETGIKGKTQNMPGEGFTTWDYTGLANHFYKKYQYDNAKKQDDKFNAIVNTIINIVETEYKTGNLDKLGVWTWCTLKSGKHWPLSKWLTVNTVAPYKKAASLIRKLLKKNEN